jgi:hypothetical protein
MRFISIDFCLDVTGIVHEELALGSENEHQTLYTDETRKQGDR